MQIQTNPKNAPADRDSDMAPMTNSQASYLRWLSEQALELEAFHPGLTRAEADRRIRALEAKLRLQNGPPHPL